MRVSNLLTTALFLIHSAWPVFRLFVPGNGSPMAMNVVLVVVFVLGILVVIIFSIT